MATSKQNIKEHVIDQLEQKKITVSEANIKLVEMERVRVIKKIPREVRNALNQGVKMGRLGHLPKKEMLPEVYFHINFEDMAKQIRSNYMNKSINALKSVCI